MLAGKSSLIRSLLALSWTYDFFTKNSGRTPALNVRTIALKEPVWPVDGIFYDPPLDFSPAPWLTSGNVNPDVEIFADFVTPISEADRDSIVNQKLRIYVISKIEYKDVFGAAHWQTYCGYLLTGGAMATCQNGNAIDNNQPKRQ